MFKYPDLSPQVVILESLLGPVADMLYSELVVGLPIFPPPNIAVGVPFHVFDVALSVLVLGVSKFDDEAGANFLGIHGRETFAIVMPFLKCPILAKSGPRSGRAHV